MRGLGLLFLGVIILGLSGCGADNESEAVKTTKTAGAPPASPDGEGKAVAPATINNMEDYAKQNAGRNNYQGTKLDKTGK
jgi:hypothetical protein